MSRKKIRPAFRKTPKKNKRMIDPIGLYLGHLKHRNLFDRTIRAQA